MANSYTLHPTSRVIRDLEFLVRPELNEGMLKAVMNGDTKLWAVHIVHDMANCEWSIGKEIGRAHV